MVSNHDQDENATLVEEYKKAQEEHSGLLAMFNEEENPHRFFQLTDRYGGRKQQLESRMKTIWDTLPSAIRETLDPPPIPPWSN